MYRGIFFGLCGYMLDINLVFFRKLLYLECCMRVKWELAIAYVVLGKGRFFAMGLGFIGQKIEMGMGLRFKQVNK